MTIFRLSREHNLVVIVVLAIALILRLVITGGGGGAIASSWRGRGSGSGSGSEYDDVTYVDVYLLQHKDYAHTANHALSVFRTDVLRRYGTGRVMYRRRENAKCDFDRSCDDDGDVGDVDVGVDAPPRNVSAPPRAVATAPCLAVTRNTYCDHASLTCSYPKCRTMITNDETCEHAHRPYDIRQYLTTDVVAMRGYLPLGPRYDAWLSYRKITSDLLHGGGGGGREDDDDHDVGYRVETSTMIPSSERKYAFNAIFSQSTNDARMDLANSILAWNATSNVTIYASMAREWHPDANSDSTEQIHTDEYVRVLSDSVFTLSPAGHNPECYRLYESIMAGSIPLLSRDDLLGNGRAYREGGGGGHRSAPSVRESPP